jgi:Fe-Mn family superoxide dismutase
MDSLKKKIETIENQLQESNQKKENLLSEAKKIRAEKLPYGFSALRQFIDPETMNIHYNKHYKGYISKLNDALEGKDHGDLSLEQIIRTIERFSTVVRNNAGGAFNHAIFWKMLTPKEMTPGEQITKKINNSFGSYANFKKIFEQRAKERFGSGWVWLVLTKRGSLKVMTTPNQDNPLMDVVKQGGFPLLGLDLWEHAYYLKYRNKRDEYIRNFWKVVNWEYVESQLLSQTKSKVNESRQFKQFLTEQAPSEACSRNQREEAKNLFNQNRTALRGYKYAIMQILKDVYPDNHYEANEYQANTMSGVYDLERPGRSVINYLNTNYSAFCILWKDLNKFLVKNNVEPISFTGKNEKEQTDEMTRMLKFINQLKFRIFSPQSQTLQTMFNVMGKTHEKGGKTEDVVEKKLKEKFGQENVIRIGELGSKEDMMGVDIKVITNGKQHTAQVKPFTTMENIDGMIKVSGTANVKKYNTDWMIFLRGGKEMVVFDNRNTQIIDGVYFFPESSVLYEL